jgi:uncharacterized protein (TIGR03435 family)
MQTSVLVITAAAAMAGVLAGAQAPDTGNAPAFEVAAIKLNKSGTTFGRIGMAPGGRFTAENIPARQLLLMAYQVQPFQIEGAPSWLESERYDIVAKADRDLPPLGPGAPGPIPQMMRGLLADRFKLVAHVEKKELPIYALVVARSDGKLGPELHPSTTDCVGLMAARRGGPPPGPPSLTDPVQCGMRMLPGNITAGSVTLSQLAQPLSNFLQRIVVDRTGLAGNFDFNLKWTPDQLPQGRGDPPPGAPPFPAIDPNGPSLAAALQEQLGVKLESTRGPVDVLVIEKIEHPTED